MRLAAAHGVIQRIGPRPEPDYAHGKPRLGGDRPNEPSGSLQSDNSISDQFVHGAPSIAPRGFHLTATVATSASDSTNSFTAANRSMAAAAASAATSTNSLKAPANQIEIGTAQGDTTNARQLFKAE